MASVSALRDGLKTRLATISGLRAHDTFRAEISPPAAIVVPGDPVVSFDSTMARGSDDFNFVITLLVANVVDRVAQDKLDAYLAGSGALSVKAAIEGDVSLGGIASFARVVSARNYGPTQVGDQEFLGVDIVVEVCASGTV